MGSSCPSRCSGRTGRARSSRPGPTTLADPAGLDHHEPVHPARADAVARRRALDERPPGTGAGIAAAAPAWAARRWAQASERPAPLRERGDGCRAHSRQGGASLVEACLDAGELVLAGADKLLGRALVGDQRHRPVGELPFGRLDGADDITIAAGDGAHHGELGDKVAEVGGAEHGVHGAQVLVLVHRHGARCQGGAGEAELLVGEALESAVVLDLPSDRLKSASRPGIARHSAADPGVECGDLCGKLTGPGLVLLQRPRTRARGSDGQHKRAGGHAQRDQGGQRQALYRVAVVQYASSRGERTTARFWSRVAPTSGRARRAGSKPNTRQGTAQVQDSPPP